MRTAPAGKAIDRAAPQIEMIGFIGACIIIDDVGPSAEATAPIVLIWVMNMKTPDITYSMKSPRTATRASPRRLKVTYMITTSSSDCRIDHDQPENRVGM